MRNKITDLRNHLFEQIEKIKDCTPEELKDELEKGKAITELARVIVDSAKAEVDYIKVTGIETPGGFIGDMNDPNLKRLQ
jgi:hypothetical protein